MPYTVLYYCYYGNLKCWKHKVIFRICAPKISIKGVLFLWFKYFANICWSVLFWRPQNVFVPIFKLDSATFPMIKDMKTDGMRSSLSSKHLPGTPSPTLHPQLTVVRGKAARGQFDSVCLGALNDELQPCLSQRRRQLADMTTVWLAACAKGS